MSASLSGRVALVTGASGSIGSATVEALARHGADLVVHYHEKKKSAERTARAVRALGRQAQVLAADVRDREQVCALVGEAVERFGRIDILVNCAGIQRNELLVTMRRQHWDDVISVNLSGPLYFCQAVVPSMIRRRFGRIINISSITGLVGQKLRTNYGAAKRGLIGLTRAMGRELAPHGVLVNAIAPQVVEGGLSKDSSFLEIRELKGLSPLGRFGRPQEVAALAAFLAGEECAYTAGAVFNLTGGLVTWV